MFIMMLILILSIMFIMMLIVDVAVYNVYHDVDVDDARFPGCKGLRYPASALQCINHRHLAEIREIMISTVLTAFDSFEHEMRSLPLLC